MGYWKETLIKSASGNKLYILMDGDSKLASNITMLEVAENLAIRGFQVDVGIAEEVVTQPEKLRVTHDLYILKSNTELSLSLAGVLHVQGARMINPYSGCIIAKDKIVTSILLKEGGVPIPQSWVTGRLELVRHVVERTPIVIKPHRGNRGRGVRVVRNVQELFAMTPPEPPMLIQEFIESGGQELKVYVVGDEVFGVRKPTPQLGIAPLEEQPSKSGSQCAVTQEVKEIAHKCAQALGLGLFGMDVLESAEGPKVVDINAFPSYSGVPNAVQLIADYICTAAREQVDNISDLGQILQNLSGLSTKRSRYPELLSLFSI